MNSRSAAREMRTIDGPSGVRCRASACWRANTCQACDCRYREAELTAFVEGFQEYRPLDNSEVWNLKPALELELIDRITEGDAGQWPTLLTSLRRIGETSWKELFEALSAVNRMLARDPAGAYARMDFESRDRYCKTHRGPGPPQQSGRDGCRRTGAASLRAGERHFRWLARGHPAHACGLLPGGRGKEGPRGNDWATGVPWRAHLSRLILRYPTSFYLLGIELLTLVMVFGILYRVGIHASAYVGFGPAGPSSHTGRR